MSADVSVVGVIVGVGFGIGFRVAATADAAFRVHFDALFSLCVFQVMLQTALSKSALSVHAYNFSASRFKEIERRREAHKERERKKKESEALAARLLEYAKHADEDEEQFGAPVAASSSATTTASTAAGQTDAGITTTDSGGDEAAAASDSTEIKTADDATSSPLSPSTEHEHQHQQETASRPVDQASEEKPCAAVELRKAACLEGKEEGQPDSAFATEVSAAATVPKPAADEEQAEAPATASSPLPTSVAAAMPAVASAASAIARPKIVRTYGRQKSSRDADADEAAASESLAASKASDEGGDSMAAVAAAAPPVNRVMNAMTAESQALWQEDEENDQLGSVGVAGPILGEDSCVLSLGLDDDDVNDDDSEHGERASSKGQAIDDDAAAAEQATSSPEDDGRQSEARIKRKFVEAAGCRSDDATGAVDVTVQREVETATPEVPNTARNSPKRDNVMTAASPETSFVKMKLTSDGELGSAPTQPSVSNFFQKGGEDAACAESSRTAKMSSSKKKKEVAVLFGATGEDASAASEVAVLQVTPEDGATSDSVVAVGSTSDGEAPVVTTAEPPAVEGKLDPTAVPTATVGEGREEASGEVADDEQEEEEEEPKEAKDRAAKYRAMLESDRAATKKAKKLRKSGMMDDEAEEEEEEEAVRGLGDFGFGVPSGRTGTSATGGGKKGDDEEDDIDEEIREEVRVILYMFAGRRR